MLTPYAKAHATLKHIEKGFELVQKKFMERNRGNFQITHRLVSSDFARAEYVGKTAISEIENDQATFDYYVHDRTVR